MLDGCFCPESRLDVVRKELKLGYAGGGDGDGGGARIGDEVLTESEKRGLFRFVRKDGPV